MADSTLFIATISALLVGLCATSAVRRGAFAIGFVDNPDHHRKLQKSPVPLGGGVAVWLAAWAGWVIGLLVSPVGTREALVRNAPLAIASLITLIVGLIDDRRGLRARHKLVGQLLAAMVLAGFGLRVDSWVCFGHDVDFGVFGYLVTVAWVLALINAFNLIDGMDGFCGGIALISCLAIAFITHQSGRFEDSVLALTLCGGLAAFLRKNLHPAKIYLGDAGSMTLGLMISALSIRTCSLRAETAVNLLPLVALVSLPLLDVVTAVGRRWLTGRSIFTPDRGHIHYRLKSRLGGVGVALGVALGLAAIGAFGAVLSSTYLLGDAASLIGLLAVVGLVAGTNTFGGSEFRLLMFRFRTAMLPLLPPGLVPFKGVRQECHLHGVRDWAEVWGALIHFGEAGGVRRIELAIDLSIAGEIYHGLWCSPDSGEDGASWAIVHTLRTGDAPAGVLRVEGVTDLNGGRYLDTVEGLVRLLKPHLEPQPDAIAAGQAETRVLPALKMAVSSPMNPL